MAVYSHAPNRTEAKLPAPKISGGRPEESSSTAYFESIVKGKEYEPKAVPRTIHLFLL